MNKQSHAGKMLRKLRLKAGLTQRAISSRFGWSSAQFVSNWERGVSLPPTVVLPELAKILGVTLKELADIYYRHLLWEAGLKRDEILGRGR